MAKKKSLKSIKTTISKEEKLLDECQAHERSSYRWLATKREDWDDKEAIFLCRLEDQLSKTTKSQVFDPVLSTIIWERAARVMARPPSGKAYAVSKDDIGKNILMNLLLKFYRKNANEQYDFLTKLRLMDVYSMVYGSFFALVPWRVNPYRNYIGPEILLINIRDVRPQPGKRSIEDSDWFIQRDMVSIDWLLKQQEANPDIWKNVDKLAARLKEKKSGGDLGRETGQEVRSYLERKDYPTLEGDTFYPQVEIFTEYRRDKWITWTPRQIDDDKSRPYILRIVENPYPEGKLPIIVKHAFPLIDSIIGLGEVERGKTLQKAINSLINLYLDGVKYSIFPPVHINYDNVIRSSIKWGPGEMWFMNNPNVDVQPMKLSPLGLRTFQSTYSFMLAAIHNMAGTTMITKMEGAEPALGKTPEAIKQMAFKESARDDWDRFMMERTIDALFTRWISLIVENLEVEQVVRVFGAEIEDLKKNFPNEKILEIFKSGKRGNVKISKEAFWENGKPVSFDFELEPGSTMRRPEDESAYLSSLLMLLVKTPRLVEEIRARGKDIDFAELLKRLLVASPVKDWDKIIIEKEEQVVEGGMEKQEEKTLPPTTATPAQPVTVPTFSDQEIAQAAQEILGGIGGIPRKG